METGPCPLCSSVETRPFYQSRLKNLERNYLSCDSCKLIFVPPRFHLSAAAQKERYLQHNNDPDDARYREFLSRLLGELTPFLRRGSKGIDYGSGPGPALATMLRHGGFDMQTYDLHFQPDRSVLSERYDFITCTETVEHFAAPRREFQMFDSILEAGGWLGLMTSMLRDPSDFPDWHYHRDPTHIAFYSESTMRAIARTFGWDVFFPRENVALFRKPL
jgi:hypothetical protein